MNRKIYSITPTTPECIKKGVKLLIDKLEKEKYAISDNIYAAQMISRYTTREKQAGQIFFSTIKHHNVNNKKCVISLNPDYEILRINDYTFKLKRS